MLDGLTRSTACISRRRWRCGVLRRLGPRIFGDLVGEAFADEVLRVLRTAGINGVQRVDLYQIFISHRSKDKIGKALIRLLAAGKVRREQRQASRGLAGEMWFAV